MVARSSSGSEPGDSVPAKIRLEADALVVLAGPSGSGKSMWAATWFRSNQIVSSDELRAVVGEHRHDLRASADAFEVLDAVVARRLARGLLTVVDTLGMDVDRLVSWSTLAREHGRPSHLVLFDEDPKVCRRRNNARPAPVPSNVLSAQFERWEETRAELGESFDHEHPSGPVAVLPSAVLAAGAVGVTGQADTKMAFGLQISAFDWPGGNDTIAEDLHANRGRGGAGGVRWRVGDGPLHADPPGRAGMGRHARGLHHARLSGRQAPRV